MYLESGRPIVIVCVTIIHAVDPRTGGDSGYYDIYDPMLLAVEIERRSDFGLFSLICASFLTAGERDAAMISLLLNNG